MAANQHHHPQPSSEDISGRGDSFRSLSGLSQTLFRLMRAVQAVSFPRSGLGLLVRLLSKYFSGDLSFKVSIREINFAGDFVYCEHYKHCGRIPCSDSRTNFQRSHDFGLRLTIDTEKPYLVLYRKPLDAIISHYEAQFRWGICRLEMDTEKFWKRFLKKQLAYYQAFQRKWVTNNWHPNTLYLQYEELVSIPQASLMKVIQLCAPDRKVDSGWLVRVVHSENISEKRSVEHFKYYDKKLFDRLKDGTFNKSNIRGRTVGAHA